MDNIEPLLVETHNRFSYFPVVLKDAHDMYKKATSTYWTVEEIDFSKDYNNWLELSDNERTFIKNILAFFAASDGIVMENLATRFYKEIKDPSVRNFYAFQLMIEGVHSETYSLLINTYIKDTTEQTFLFNAMNTMPCVKKKSEWALKWITSNDHFGKRLLAFACVEGLFFSGAFCSIYWIKEQNKLPGLCFSNEFIARDESLHTMFAVLLYTKYVVNKLSQDEVYQMFNEAIEIEIEFITESIPCRLIGMNSDLMIQYVKFIADRLLVQLGYMKLYNTTNPFQFMEKIGIENKTNFFEGRVGEYAKSTIKHTTELDVDNDF
jgi:ribonucleoside-diphosphate reductase beta chain